MYSYHPGHPVYRMRCNVIQRLATDLTLLQDIKGPPPHIFEQAQYIDDWSIEPMVVHALRGRVHNLPDAPAPFTSQQLFVLDPGLGYARTLTRLVKLGIPSGNGRENNG